MQSIKKSEIPTKVLGFIRWESNLSEEEFLEAKAKVIEILKCKESELEKKILEEITEKEMTEIDRELFSFISQILYYKLFQKKIEETEDKNKEKTEDKSPEHLENIRNFLNDRKWGKEKFEKYVNSLEGEDYEEFVKTFIESSRNIIWIWTEKLIIFFQKKVNLEISKYIFLKYIDEIIKTRIGESELRFLLKDWQDDLMKIFGLLEELEKFKKYEKYIFINERKKFLESLKGWKSKHINTVTGFLKYLLKYIEYDLSWKNKNNYSFEECIKNKNPNIFFLIKNNFLQQ